MRFLPFLLLAACGGGSTPEPGHPPEIRVLLATFAPSEAVELAVDGAWRLLDADTGEDLESGRDLRRSIAVRSTRLSRPLRLVPGDGRLLIEGRPYPGHLLIRANGERADLILSTDLEDYLPGVIAGEMSAKFHPAALRAQAVMARTYARHRMKERGDDVPWHVTDDTRDQVYIGQPRDPVFADAVQRTRGLILTGAAGPLPGWYHSTCGGHTASAHEVFGVPDSPALVGVPCGYCSISPRFRWDPPIRLPLAYVVERLGLTSAPAAVTVTERRRDGRAGRVRFEAAPPVEVTGEDLRFRLGVEKLRSTRIHRIRVEGDAVVFEGGGSGHGVGLCQWGAEGMARAGASAADILTHYAPGAVLGRIY